MSKNGNKLKHQSGIITPRANGTYLAVINHRYKKHRKVHQTIENAQEWIERTENTLHSKQVPLTPYEQLDAQEALKILRENNTSASFVEMAKEYIEGRTHTPKPIGDAIEGFHESREQRGLRKRSLDSIYICRKFGRFFEGKEIGGISVQDVTGFLDGLGVAPKTRNNYIRDLKTLYSWAIKQGFATKNPILSIETSKIDKVMPGVLTVEQVATLMEAAEEHEPEVIPYIATGFFAGLRVGECDRIGKSAFGESIHVGSEAAKVRSQRFVDIGENLTLWLNRYPPKERLRVINHKERYWALRDKAGITEWPHNAARHSFATYHLAKHQDATQTAYQLGHPNPDLLYSHYRNLATKKDGNAYFDITPKR